MRNVGRSWLGIAAFACTMSALAQQAITTQAVNVRAGPDRHFPRVTWLHGNTGVTVIGCIEGWRWCDIVAGRDRGWVYSRYLAFPRGGQSVVILNGGPTLGLPVITFSVGAYWGAHYRGRPWFANQRYWDTRWQRRPPPPAWRPPPPRPPSARPPPARPPSGRPPSSRPPSDRPPTGSRPPGDSGRPPSGSRPSVPNPPGNAPSRPGGDGGRPRPAP